MFWKAGARFGRLFFCRSNGIISRLLVMFQQLLREKDFDCDERSRLESWGFDRTQPVCADADPAG